MMGWMTVEVRPLLTAPGRPAEPRASLLVPKAGCEVLAYPSGRDECSGRIIDEHLAVDADRCREIRWLQCADVLYGYRRRSPKEAVVWLAQVMAAFGACRLAATAVGEGRWAAQDGAGRPPVCVAAESEATAVASCLHGWMVAGGSLEGLALGPRRPCVRENILTAEAGSPLPPWRW